MVDGSGLVVLESWIEVFKSCILLMHRKRDTRQCIAKDRKF
jgi:hypothetical protein